MHARMTMDFINDLWKPDEIEIIQILEYTGTNIHKKDFIMLIWNAAETIFQFSLYTFSSE